MEASEEMVSTMKSAGCRAASMARRTSPMGETAPVEVYVQKVRFQEIGGLTADRPALFRHDKVTGQYREVTTW